MFLHKTESKDRRCEIYFHLLTDLSCQDKIPDSHQSIILLLMFSTEMKVMNISAVSDMQSDKDVSFRISISQCDPWDMSLGVSNVIHSFWDKHCDSFIAKNPYAYMKTVNLLPTYLQESF